MSKEKYVIYIAILTASFGYIYDFDSAVISSSVEILADTFKINKQMIGILVTIVLIGGLVGGLCAGYFSEKIGRKRTIIYSLLVFLMGGFITIFSPNIEMFMFGRLIMGLGLGSVFLVGAIYVIEISPIETRGRNGTINQLFMPLGLVIGFWLAYIVTNYLEDKFILNNSWRILFSLEVFQGIIIFMLFLKIPESPRWLYLKGFEGKAKESLKKVLSEDRVEKVLQDLSTAKTNTEITDKINLKKINKGTIILLLLIIISAIFRQFSEINPVMNLKSESFPFFIFFTVSMVSLFFIPFIPETKGKTLEEIGEKWKSIK